MEDQPLGEIDFYSSDCPRRDESYVPIGKWEGEFSDESDDNDKPPEGNESVPEDRNQHPEERNPIVTTTFLGKWEDVSDESDDMEFYVENSEGENPVVPVIEDTIEEEFEEDLIEEEPEEDKEPPSVDDRTVFVGNLKHMLMPKFLEEFCSQAGPVEKAKIVVNTQTGLSLGYGFVTYKDRQSAKRAIRTLSSKMLAGREVYFRPRLPDSKKENEDPEDERPREHGPSYRGRGGYRGRGRGGFGGRGRVSWNPPKASKENSIEEMVKAGKKITLLKREENSDPEDDNFIF